MSATKEVRARGVEPPRPYGHRNLNPARLPIPPRPQLRVKKWNDKRRSRGSQGEATKAAEISRRGLFVRRSASGRLATGSRPFSIVAPMDRSSVTIGRSRLPCFARGEILRFATIERPANYVRRGGTARRCAGRVGPRVPRRAAQSRSSARDAPQRFEPSRIRSIRGNRAAQSRPARPASA
jgi:hypothetical protein